MAALRARMKEGHRPIVLGGVFMVPEFPEYWPVPVSASAAVENHVQAGEIEYESELARSAGGQFAVSAAVQRTPVVAGRFQRKAGK